MSAPRIVSENDRLLPQLSQQAVARWQVKPDQAETDSALDELEVLATKPQKSKKALSPSLVDPEGCPLETWYSFFRELYPWIDPQDKDTRRKWNTANVLGKQLHKAWQNCLIESWLLSNEMTEVAPKDYSPEAQARALGYGFSDWIRVDGILLDYGKRRGLEIKGIAGKDFEPFNYSKLKANSQAQAYMFVYGLEEMHFVAVNRDAHNWFGPSAVKEFIVTRDDDAIAELLDYAVFLNQAIANKTPPPGNSPSTYYCKNLCGSFTYCFAWNRKGVA